MEGTGEKGSSKMKMQLIRIVKPLVEHFPKLAMTYRRWRDNCQFFGSIPEETPVGFKFIGNKAMRQGMFEAEETEVIKKLLQKVDVLLNVGANIGYYCCIALSLEKSVVAFEPIALNLKYLLKNITVNNWRDKIEIFPLALSNKVGIIEIYGGGTGASLVKGWAGTPEQYVSLVPTSTLDIVLGSRFQDRRCLVLVDIEGSEKLMLEGASYFLCAKPKPIWMVEISISEHQPRGVNINPILYDTFKMFWDRDYETFTANTQCRQVYPEEIENILRTGENTLLTHNFLFIERGRKAELLDA